MQLICSECYTPVDCHTVSSLRQCIEDDVADEEPILEGLFLLRAGLIENTDFVELVDKYLPLDRDTDL